MDKITAQERELLNKRLNRTKFFNDMRFNRKMLQGSLLSTLVCLSGGYRRALFCLLSEWASNRRYTFEAWAFCFWHRTICRKSQAEIDVLTGYEDEEDDAEIRELIEG